MEICVPELTIYHSYMDYCPRMQELPQLNMTNVLLPSGYHSDRGILSCKSGVTIVTKDQCSRKSLLS